jgi:uncharacterized protein
MDPGWIFALVWVLSALTLTTGVGAGVVYAPVFLLFFEMSPAMATGTSILIQFAGVGTTAVGHIRGGSTDRTLAGRLALAAVFGLVVGRVTYGLIPHTGAQIAYVAGLAAVGAWLLFSRRRPLSAPTNPDQAEQRVTSDEVSYVFCRPTHGYWLASLAGLATALIGISGAGIQSSALMLRCRLPPKIAVGTGTAAAAITLAVGSVMVAVAGEVDWPVIAIAIPAAILGALTARLLAKGVPPQWLAPAIGFLMLAMAAGLTVGEVLL